MQAEISESRFISCRGVSLEKGYPLEDPVQATILFEQSPQLEESPQANKTVACPLFDKGTCLAAKKENRMGCIQLLPYESTPEESAEISSEVKRTTPTYRETEILTLHAKGTSNYGIAKKYSIRIQTVDVHQGNLLRKYDVHSAEAAVVKGMRRREVPLDEIAAEFDFTKAANLTGQENTILHAFVMGKESTTYPSIAKRAEKKISVVQRSITASKTKLDVLTNASLAAYYEIAENTGIYLNTTEVKEEKKVISPGESRVLSLKAFGLSNKEVAKNLSIKVRTVETHLASIYKKYDLHSADVVVLKGIRDGDITVDKDAFDLTQAADLTGPENTILRALIASTDKFSYADIAKSIDSNFITVEKYMKLIKKKLNLRNDIALAVYYELAENAGLCQESSTDIPRLSKPDRKKNILTPAEAQVLSLKALGLTSREIGGKLFITKSTVDVHLENVYKKYDVHSAGVAVIKGIRDGDITIDEDAFDLTQTADLTGSENTTLHALVDSTDKVSYADIAERLNSNTITVMRYMEQIKGKLNLRKDIALAAYYELAKNAGLCQENSQSISELPKHESASPDAKKIELTPSEWKILTLRAKGLKNSEIAELLDISFRTVESHQANLFGKYEVHSAEAAVVKAIRREDIILNKHTFNLPKISQLLEKEKTALRDFVARITDEPPAYKTDIKTYTRDYSMEKIKFKLNVSNYIALVAFYEMAKREGLVL